LELTQSNKFDVLLTDIRMAGKFDGLGVAVCARALDPSIPLITATGYADELTQRLTAFGPPVLPLKKPYRLIEAVEALVGLHLRLRLQ
jgi:CheY-like chemotaxis protein